MAKESKEKLSYKDVYGSGGNFLNAAIVKGEKLMGKDLKIEDIQIQNIRDKEKLVATFSGHDKVLVINVTNAKILAESFGDDYMDWVGKTLRLLVTKTDFQGELVDSIQVVV